MGVLTLEVGMGGEVKGESDLEEEFHRYHSEGGEVEHVKQAHPQEESGY